MNSLKISVSLVLVFSCLATRMKRIGWFPLAGVLLMAHVSAGAPSPPPWSSGGPFGARVTALYIDAATRTLYAGTFNSGIYKSTDRAEEWQKKALETEKALQTRKAAQSP